MKDVVVHTPNSISERTNLFNAPRKLARSIWIHRSLIVQMTRREVTGRYKGSLLGLAWSFFNPLLMLVIYTFFFSVIFNARWGTDAPGGKAAFAIILFSGLIMHTFLAECINRAPGLIVGNVNYVKRVVFPLEILTLISMGSALFHAAISLLALFAAQLAFMQEMHWTVVFLPLVMLPLVLAAMGLSWILASLGVFVRDVGQMTGTAMTILLFLSPVFYPISALPEKYRGWLMLNPLTFIIENARKVIVFGTYPDFRQLLVGTVIAGVVAIFGFWWFQKTRKGLPMSSDEVAISVRGVSKRYEMYDTPRQRLKQFFVPALNRVSPGLCHDQFREFWALRDIDFEVKRGEAVGIVGRNGSGKSTLLQIITGTLSPTTGEVRTSGRIAALLELGSGFNHEYSGRENVYLNGALLGLTPAEIDEKFDAIAGFADIGDHLEQPVKTYSSGMLVRLAFAVQVQLRPDILIVDEALAVGDALFQKRCFQQIERLVSDGVSLLFVSHDQESVRTLTNRALLLRDGRQIGWGTSSEVIVSYRRLLHEEESRYFSSLTEKIAASAALHKQEAEPSLPVLPLDTQADAASSPPVGEDEVAQGARSGNMSFGDQQAFVVKVETLDEAGDNVSVYYPSQRITIRVECESRVAISNLNVGIRIRNKEGFKIYSWGTLNQDMKRLAGLAEGEVFWNRQFAAGERFSVTFTCDCDLGVNLYEIQAAVSFEERPDYTSQRILHWMDEAAFFQVLMRRDEHFFGGVIDLRMQADWDR